MEHQHLANDELVHLAAERDQLTDQARLDLDGELTRRRITTSEIESHKVETQAVEKAEKLRLWKLGYISRVGFWQENPRKDQSPSRPRRALRRIRNDSVVRRPVVPGFSDRDLHRAT